VTIGQSDGIVFSEKPGDSGESAFKVVERTTSLPSVREVNPDTVQNGGNVIGIRYGVAKEAVNVRNQAVPGLPSRGVVACSGRILGRWFDLGL
jgi:hypothetical protein